MGTFGTIRRMNPGRSAPSHPSTEAEFWAWFAANESRLADIDHARDRGVEDILLQLMRVHEDLTLDVGVLRDGGRELVVSACGNPRVVPAVLKLVAAAPPLQQWTVTAFRQRRAARGSFVLHCGGTVDLAGVRFSARRAGNRVDLALFIPGFRRRFADEYRIVAALVLDMVLGELDAMTRVRDVTVGPPRWRTHSRPLAELASVVDAAPPD